jgi:branched-chain amino acid transport system substrate-binding protein
MRRLSFVAALALALAVAAAAGASAGAGTSADPGVTPTTVLIGGTVPLSGEAAAFGSVAPGAKAYFDYVNARGGVNGRKIEYRYYDDAYNPANTVQLTRKLVEQDKVLAIFNAVGTANNLATRDYLNAGKVPQLFAGDGSTALGSSPAQYPWTMGFLPSYQGEGATYGRDLVKLRPKARIAVLLENTELGKDMTRGLSRAIAGRGPRVVASEPYEYTSADVASQVAKLKTSGADTLMLFATPKFMIQAIVAAHKLGWRPKLYLASVSIEPTIMGIAKVNAPELTKGARSIAFVKNPEDPIWAKDPAVKLYRSILARHAPSARPSDVYNWYGMTVAWTMVETLRRAGKGLSRATLLKAARSLDTTRNPFLLPGIRVRTGPTDSYPLDTLYLYEYDNSQWVKASRLLPAR